jgi:uncharacterized membrane protein YgdD (TMEM256/DUF423 family)
MNFPRYKLWLFLGALLGGLAVAAGAFGAHGLESHLEKEGLTADESRLLAVWDTAAHYQMVHALALLAVGLVTARHCGRAINIAGGTMTLGTLIFSGCLYALVLTRVSVLGAIVPIGGVLMIVGWAALAVAVLRLREK